MSRSRADSGRPDPFGRGRLTRRLPVLWQAEPEAPSTSTLDLARLTRDAGPRRFTLRVASSARRQTVPAAALSITEHVALALLPVLAGLAVDRALGSQDLDQLFWWLALLGLNMAALSVSLRLTNQLSAYATQNVQHRLRAALSEHVVHATSGRLRRGSGDILSTATNDVTRLALAVNLLVYPIGELAGIVFIAVALFAIHWQLGLVVAVGAPLAVWSMSLIRGPFTRRTRRSQTLLAGAVAEATDLATGYRVIKGLRAEDEAVRRYRRSSRAALHATFRTVAALAAYLAGSSSISGLFVVSVAGVAGLLAVSGEIGVGGLIAAVGLAQALLPPLTMVTANAGAVWASAVASGTRILDLLEESGRGSERAASLRPLPPNGTPSLEISIPTTGAVQVAPGEIVGLRTDDRTAAALMAALLDPPEHRDAVQVQVDGVPAEGLRPDDYRQRVVVAPHSGTIFSGSVLDNLERPGLSPAWRDTVLDAACCTDFVGVGTVELSTPLGEDARRISGGQRQRLALARALAHDAPALVLHDPTTSVDSVTETLIAERLRDLRAGRTTLIIADSPALLGACDRLVDLEACALDRVGTR